MKPKEKARGKSRSGVVTLIGAAAVLALYGLSYIARGKLDASFLIAFTILTCTWVAGVGSGLAIVVVAAIAKLAMAMWVHPAAASATFGWLDGLLIAALGCTLAWATVSVRKRLSALEIEAMQSRLELERQKAERQRTELDLRTSDERFRQLNENIKEVFWITDVGKTEMIYISPGYESIWGRPCQSLYQNPRSWIDAIHPEDRERVIAAAMKQQSGGYDEQYRIVRPDGGCRWIRDRGFPVYDERGAVYRIAGVADDITVQKEAEEALSKSELQLRLVWDNSLDGMRLMDEEGIFIAVNDAYCRIVDLPRDQLVGKSLAVIFPEARREPALARYRERFRDRAIPARSEEKLTLWNGRTVHLEISRSFVQTQGSPVRLLSIFRDVSDRKKAEAALAEKEERFHRFLDNSAMIAFVKDEQGRFQYVNPTLQRHYGFSLIGKTVFDIHAPQVAKRLDAKDREVLASTSTIEFTDAIPFPDGTVTDWVNYKFPFKDSAGARYIGCVAIEVTHQRRLERQLLEISDREQARIGHDLHDELCQFLVGILFHCHDLSDALERSEHPEADRAWRIAELVDTAINQARQLARGLFPVLLEKEGLVPALQEFALGVNGRFKTDCTVQCDTPVRIRHKVVANHLYRIAQEAVNNAARHGNARQIRICLGASDSSFHLAVTDDGSGIDNTGGARGMGLDIMNYRARSIGGVLEITSPPESGTSIVCRVPIEKL